MLNRRVHAVLDVPIDVVSWTDALDRLLVWGADRQSRCICICNVHSVITARQDTEFQRAVIEADMATPDGAPVAWMLRRLTGTDQQRVNGPDFMWRYLSEAERIGQVVSFFGGSDSTLCTLRSVLVSSFPALRLGEFISPPFRELSIDEDAAYVDRINAAGTSVLFVGLGCPKQEKWMAAHRGRIQAVMVGVGAAFDYHAGTIKRAPVWMQNTGMEWLHRLASEPRRLWKRYLVTNTLFIIGAAWQLMTGRLGR